MVRNAVCKTRVGGMAASEPFIEIHPDGEGARFVLTEYGDYLDGYDDAGSREHGTNALMDELEKSLTD